jgi:hypothetical protein
LADIHRLSFAVWWRVFTPAIKRDNMKNKFNTTLKSVCVALVSASMLSCASTGNESLRQESEATINHKLTEGKTTKAEVRAMFQSPASTSFTDAGLEIWKYELSKMSADAVNFIPVVSWFGSSTSGTKKELVVLFDDKGILKRYSMSESPVSVKTGVFNN